MSKKPIHPCVSDWCDREPEFFRSKGDRLQYLCEFCRYWRNYCQARGIPVYAVKALWDKYGSVGKNRVHPVYDHITEKWGWELGRDKKSVADWRVLNRRPPLWNYAYKEEHGHFPNCPPSGEG